MSSYRMKYRIGSTQYNIPVMDDISGFGSGIPVGTVLPFMGSTLPSGFLWCDGSAVSRTLFPDLFTAIGTAFGSGDGSTTFNLPKLDSGEFLEGSSSAGTSKDAGLPNIDGEFSYVFGMGYNNNSGCLSATKVNGFSYGGSSISSYATVKVDASQSNPIYGNSQTVQPKSLTTRYIIKAFDSQSQASALIDVTQYASALNQKPSKSLNDLTQAGEDHFYENDFCFVYPNGGTAENPANVAVASRYFVANPFPGYEVMGIAEFYYGGYWIESHHRTNHGSLFGIDVYYSEKLDNVVVVTGASHLYHNNATFTGQPPIDITIPDITTPTPCRVKVWKIGKIPTQSS